MSDCSGYTDMIEGAVKLAERREALCKNVPPCPYCGEAHQIQLLEWFGEVEWKCRECGHVYQRYMTA